MTVNSLGRNSIQYYPIVVKLCLETCVSQLIIGAAMTVNSLGRNSIQYYPIGVKLCHETLDRQLIRGGGHDS